MSTTTLLGPGAKLRAAREEALISRKELADRLGVSYASLADLEADRKPISLEKILEVCAAIPCDPYSIDTRLAKVKLTMRSSSPRVS